jgi:hypothetical protein
MTPCHSNLLVATPPRPADRPGAIPLLAPGRPFIHRCRMPGALIKTVAHVPGFFLKLSLDREPVAIRTCARLRWRAHSGITKRTTPPAIQSAAASQAPGSGGGRTVERTPNPALRFGPAFSRGQRLISQILAGIKSTAGKCFSFLPRVKFLQEPSRGIAHRFQFSPVLSSALCHGQTMQQKDGKDHGKSIHKYG